MKKLNLLLLFSTAVAFLFASCSDKQLGPVANTESPGTPAITSHSSGESYILQEEQANDTLMTLVWSKPDYGFSSAIISTIQMAETGTEFANPIELTKVNGTSHSVTVGAMNSLMLGNSYTGGQEVNMDLRVMTELADSLGQQISEAISLSITPYSICQFCPSIYVAGNFQAASGYSNDWSPSDGPALNTIEGGDAYEGYVYMAGGSNEFKFTAEDNWDNGDWGDNGADGTLDSGGDNILAPNSGYYKVNVDLNALTFTMTDTQWGLIGSATANGWDSDQDMTYNASEKTWTITTDLASGLIKFRANDAWDINYGDNGADGTLEAGGTDISVSTAGNYTITLDLSSSPYTYSLTQN